MFGVCAYPAQGIHKSIVSRTDKRVLLERLRLMDEAFAFIDHTTRQEILDRHNLLIAKEKIIAKEKK